MRRFDRIFQGPWRCIHTNGVSSTAHLFETKEIQAFEFTFRSSVEHYVPQTPVEDKQHLMMKEYDWNELVIKCHYQQMKFVLKNSLITGA